jgi:hypothetical protein
MGRIDGLEQMGCGLWAMGDGLWAVGDGEKFV